MTLKQKISCALGLIWALPVTLIGLLLLSLCGGCRVKKSFWVKVTEGKITCLALVVEGRNLWMFPRNITGVTFGNLIIIRDMVHIQYPSALLYHEAAHTYQCCVLGVLTLVLYPLASLLSWILYNDFYRGNYFEMMARLKSGEVNLVRVENKEQEI